MKDNVVIKIVTNFYNQEQFLSNGEGATGAKHVSWVYTFQTVLSLFNYVLYY